jgi:hypothetical protein
MDSVEDYARKWTKREKEKVDTVSEWIGSRWFKFESENSEGQWAQKQHMYSKILGL